MRRVVKILTGGEVEKHYGDNCWVINGISLIDIAKFLLQRAKKLLVYIDIDQASSLKSESHISVSKGKKLRTLKKKQHSYQIGTNVIIATNKGIGKLLDKTHDQLLVDHSDLNEFDFFVSVHDFDWQAICFFKDANVFQELADYIEKRALIEHVKDWDNLIK